MKQFLQLCILVALLNPIQSLLAQQVTTAPDHDIERHPIYDFGNQPLKNTGSIPGYESHAEPLKITGTVYKSDGVTPAKDVIVFINQTNDDGVFDVKSKDDKKFIYHRAWVKTDDNGAYTFYTFVPGTNYGSNELKRIYTFIKEPGTPEYEIDGFLFGSDPYLSRFCRKRLKKTGSNAILTPVKQENILVATRDIVLTQTLQASN